MRKYLYQARLNERPLSHLELGETLLSRMAWTLQRILRSLPIPLFPLAKSDACKSPCLSNHILILDFLNLDPILSEFQNLISPPQNSSFWNPHLSLTQVIIRNNND